MVCVNVVSKDKFQDRYASAQGSEEKVEFGYTRKLGAFGLSLLIYTSSCL